MVSTGSAPHLTINVSSVPSESATAPAISAIVGSRGRGEVLLLPVGVRRTFCVSDLAVGYLTVKGRLIDSPVGTSVRTIW